MAHPGGRPLKFQSVEDLQRRIDDYFENETEEMWTWTGLALHLDTDRETLSSYKEREEFSDSVKKALLRVQNAYERDLRRKGRSGDIFALKNFGWKDRTETDITTNGKDINEQENIDTDAITMEVVKRLKDQKTA